MSKSSMYLRREVPLFLVSAFLLLQVAAYFLEIGPIDIFAKSTGSWLIIIGTFTFGFAIVSILQLHGSRILKQEGDWIFSTLVVGSMLIVLITGLIPPLSKHSAFNWLYQYMIVPPSRATYSMLAAFVTSASYRALRARSTESVFALLAAVFIMLRNAPIGAFFWSGFPVIGNWILQVPNSSGFSALKIALGVGIISLCLRLITGKERGFLGDVGGE